MTKILLVEDDKNLREIYGTRLYAEGYDIVSAGDGEEALAMAIRERPNLIISDVMMPKISGFDMLDILRTSTDTKDIPVIMMTALSSEDQRARGESLGATRYLVKSQVGIEDVVRTVHEVLRDAPGMAPANAGQASTPAPQNPNVSNQATPPPTPQAPTRNDTPYQPAVSQQRPSPQVNTQPRTVPQATAAPQQAQAPTAPSVPAPEAGPLPKPIAPFSTQRPASLGDRVLHPITPASNNQQDDLAAKMAAALSGEPELNIATPPQPAGDAQQSQTPPMPAPVNPMNQQIGSSPADNTQAAPTANQELPSTPQVPNQQQPPQQPTV